MSPFVRSRTLWLAAACVLVSHSLSAQDARGRRVGSVPRDVAREAATIFNAPSTKRVRGDYTLAATDSVRGDVAVLGGRAKIDGTITGQLVVVNGDAMIAGSGRIDGSLTVIGGTFESPDRPQIGGDIRVWSARLRYHEDADTLVADVDRELFTRWARWQRDDPDGTESQLFLTTAHTYNRVEGLPVYLGPRLRVHNGDTRAEAELFGIFRTGTGIDWTPQNRGYRLRGEIRQGRKSGFLVGARVYDEVDAVEHWQLRDSEVGLASFLFTRDYRDYFGRHGASGYAGLIGPANTELRASYSTERWTSQLRRSVPTLFNTDVAWRANPRVDDGVMHLFTLTGRLDTRNRPDNPRSGWLLEGEFEHGTGTLSSVAARTIDVSPSTPGPVSYGRVLLDLRRYTRLGPGGQLNLRAVAGGWVSGDPLPAERQLSVSGIDALPGYDFRQIVGATDVGTCAGGSSIEYLAMGRPAQCQRIVLLQAEWKGDFRFDPFGSGEGFGDRRWMAGKFKADGAVVLFANTGRGWVIGESFGDLGYNKSTLPPTRTWHSDVGGGLDFGDFGVYVAQAVSQSSRHPNFYMRLGHRF